MNTHLATKFKEKNRNIMTIITIGNVGIHGGKVGDDFRDIKRFVDVTVYLTACNLSQAENAFPSSCNK